MTDRSKTVVMLIDWDNLQICHSRDAPGTDLDLQALIALAQSYGTLVSARAYAEWNLLSERLAVYKAGIEPVFAPVMRPEGSPREGKSLADTVMVADGVDLLWTVAPDVFVLVTSDKDMIPLARIAKQRGAAVVILGSDLTAIPLVEISNVFITYRQLLRELDRVSELEAPAGRAPARERRLRESRRPSSEPYGGASQIGSGSTAARNIGTGSRGSGRSVGAPTSTRPRIEHAEPAPARRFSEGSPAGEPERPALVAASPTLSAPSAADLAEALDPAGLSGSDATPRRRRRRGGRGRRTGLGVAGDGDQEAATQSADLFEGTDEDDEATAPAAEISPDDLDSAVLQLLASRDQASEPEQDSRPEAEPPAEPVAETPPTSGVAQRSTSRRSLSRTGTTSPARRRAVTTTFSEFGPSSGQSRSTRPARASVVEESAAETPAQANVDEPDAGMTPATSADSERPPGGAIWAPGATDVTGPTSGTESAAADTAPSTPEASANGTPATTAEASADADSAASDEAPKPVRRRRTRRPATPKAAANDTAAEAPSEAPVAAESGA